MTEIVLEYSDQEDQQAVLQWLRQEIPVAGLTHHGYSGFDTNKQYVWRMALRHGDRRVMFNDRHAAIQFAMRWG